MVKFHHNLRYFNQLEPMNEPPLLDLVGIEKSFPGVSARKNEVLFAYAGNGSLETIATPAVHLFSVGGTQAFYLPPNDRLHGKGY